MVRKRLRSELSTWRNAMELMSEALEKLDEAEAPAEIRAYLDLATELLRRHIASHD